MKQSISLKKLKKEAKEAYKKDKEIVDIILFGSVTKGKDSPKDIDVIILFNKKIDRSILKQHNPIIKTYAEFFDSFPAESIITEGHSLIFDKKIHELYKMRSAYIFRYTLKDKNKSQRMQFYYALYGRNMKGILDITNSKKFSDQTVLTPVENAEQMKEFFESNKIDFFYMPILYPETYSKAEKLSVSNVR